MANINQALHMYILILHIHIVTHRLCIIVVYPVKLAAVAAATAIHETHTNGNYSQFEIVRFHITMVRIVQTCS